MRPKLSDNGSQTASNESRQGLLPGVSSFGYAPPGGRWDEMMGADGSLRPHWAGFAQTFESLSGAELDERWRHAQRHLRENGVSYNVYGDPRGIDRPWQLDPVPLLISASEWRSIEVGLTQRARLLNAVLADLYNHQSLLTQSHLPPQLVFGHPGYLRPVRHVDPPGGVHMHFYAADLARAPDGRWWVVSDRTDAPSGAGYALENRIVVSRVMPEALRSQPVEPLSPFFQGFRDHLTALSPRNRESPRVVLLTPGPYNETYFEHAYLARQLGCTLVEGEDLAMRDGRIFLKTLDGLQAVDVILRRTDSAFCDPLELRNDSTLGIAGLVQAVRGGTVAIANALGSGLAEGGALAPFLPALARHLLGEDLHLPTVATLWCGDEKNRQRALSNIADFVFKPAWPGASATQFGDNLNQSGREQLREAIMASPGAFIAQERMALSSAPVWSDGALEPRPLLLRVFVAASANGYVVMPGGLTRIAPERGGAIVSMQDGGGSKDSWVLADAPRKTAQPITAIMPRERLVRGSQDLPSRVADNLFWLGRYIERSEDTTRLLRAAFSRSGSVAGLGSAEELPVILSLLAMLDKRKMAPDAENEMRALAIAHFGPAAGEGLSSTAARIHRSATLARDRLSLDTWRAANRLCQEIETLSPTMAVEDTLTGLNNAVLAGEALSGLAMENMTRGLSWCFVDIGRRLERAVHVLDLLSGCVVQEEGMSGPGLTVMLEILDSVMTYRSRYFSAPQLAPVLDLLLADESNPRSLVFQINALDEHMARLGQARRAAFLGMDQRLTIWLSGAVRTAEIEMLAKPDEDGGQRTLGRFLEMLRSKLWELSETVTREYFTHAVGRNTQAHGPFPGVFQP